MSVNVFCSRVAKVLLLLLGQHFFLHAQTIKERPSKPAFSNPVAPVGNSTLKMPSSVKPILDIWMRDTYVTKGPDNYFYLTGTTASPGRIFPGQIHCWDYNDGLYLWRSKDMKSWEALGAIWTFDKDAAPWQKKGKPIKPGSKSLNGDPLDSIYRAVWAPELHYIKSQKKWLLAACLNGANGSFVLESVSGKPEGPYRNIKGNQDKAIFPNIDLGIFEDTTGEVYLVGHNHYIAKMNADLSNIAEPFRNFRETPYETEPYIEGVWLDKYNGKYQLLQTVWSIKKPDGTFTYLRDEKKDKALYSYDVVVAESTNIYGPYGPRYPAILEGGHNNLFKDARNNWWSTTFFNPRGIMGTKFDVTCRPAVVPMKWVNNKLMPDAERARIFYGDLKSIK
ncbi:family 43 glycosylhydrolase [Pedobacter sandarakinus]|uniref:family 43 glycosylhydrolase n=1 Tax=Pedobacter sandarakinus TaxID=353156 RepID=UPI00224507B8|nr:family 43 glycosylhydrolase [Pedobacter sandarakinus]MCX2575448.1 family 43 glycosylhydrolase [Pedobacter sandarakinus]